MTLRYAGLCALAALALSALVGETAAQSYPERQIKMIVPFPPGGPTDVMARIVGQNIAAKLGHPVIVENRAGAGGTIGARAVAAAEPDGYTLLFGSTSTLAIAPALFKNLDYDPARAFAPVAMVSDVPFVLVVTSDLATKSIQEFVAYAKANPGKLTFASAGSGTPPHLTGEMFKAATATDIVHVPYKGGAPAISDVIAGQVNMTFETTSVLLSLIQEGKLRALAVTSAARQPDLPNVPTLVESGFAGFVADSWTGVVAPAGTPAAVILKLNGAINDGLNLPATRTSFTKLGVEARVGSPEDLANLMVVETQKWSAIVKSSGATIE